MNYFCKQKTMIEISFNNQFYYYKIGFQPKLSFIAGTLQVCHFQSEKYFYVVRRSILRDYDHNFTPTNV